jgi:hypothetical protein
MQSRDALNLQQNSQEEELICQHISSWLLTQTANQIIDSFRGLFIEGKQCSDTKVFAALETIVKSKEKEKQLVKILSRCSRLILYTWQKQPVLQPAIAQLMELFEQIPPVKHRGYHSSHKLQQLVRDFTKTEEYLRLKLLANLFVKNKIDLNEDSQQIGHSIQRYPFFYEHCLLDESSSYEDWQIVQQVQARNQQLSEFNLSQYIIYKVRLIQLARSGNISERKIGRIQNPTLLSEQEISTAIKQFKIRSEGNLDSRTLSQRLLTQSKQSNYQVFKEDLYQYLITSIDPKYGQHQFNHKLQKKLQELLPESNSKKVDELMLTRTCTKILNFLVVDQNKELNHYVFVDLVTNIGATSTVNLLLKIILLCPKSKPHLEKRLAILFEHYKTHKIKDVPWLIKTLENLQIAFSIHFGKLDLSVFKIL